jgi:hypothetical protein
MALGSHWPFGQDLRMLRRLTLRRSAAGFAALLLATAASGTTAKADRGDDPRIVYDSEFQGYVPVVNGVERPDLVTQPGEGRVPDDIREALRMSRRALRRGSEWDGENSRGTLRVSRRWARRTAVTTELRVIGSREQPVAGARVYRYVDPAFYPVNEDTDGARLFGAYRYLPFPFPAVSALSAVQLHDETWLDDRMAPVASAGPDIDFMDNPWLDERLPVPRLPIEYVGETDEAGRLTAICGVFNLLDEDKFPRSIVPSSLRVGYVVIAEGYRTAFSERRFTEGGVEESRALRLLEDATSELFRSLTYQAAERVVDSIDVSASRPVVDAEGELDRVLETLTPAVVRLDERWRLGGRREAEARLVGRLYRRAPRSWRLPLARRAAFATPDSPARVHRLAREIVASAGLYPGSRLAAAGEVTRALPNEEDERKRAAGLEEASRLLRTNVERHPAFVPSYGLLDAVLSELGVGYEQRSEDARRLLRLYPFERWARARVAVALLGAGHIVEAFDHLRYTWTMTPRLGGDIELGRALADHYWRLGLTEKAAIFSRLLSGSDPEDPRGRVRRNKR